MTDLSASQRQHKGERGKRDVPPSLSLSLSLSLSFILSNEKKIGIRSSSGGGRSRRISAGDAGAAAGERRERSLICECA